MSTLLELSAIGRSNDLKDMMVVLFQSKNKKDLITANYINIVDENLATCVRERDQLFSELDNCLGSTTAYESAKLLREMNDADLAKARFGAVSFSCYSKGDMKFRDRVFPHKVGLTTTSLDLLDVIEDEEYFSKLCDVDAIRVCLLLSLEVIFMGRLMVNEVDDTLMRLVDSLESWNAFPWGEHIWMHLYDEIRNVVFNHKSEHLEGLHKSRNYVPTYTLSGFVWAFKVWILESFERSNRWWNKVAEAIPRVYVPRTPIRKPDLFDAYLQKVFVGRKRNRLCRHISTPITNVPRSKISIVKDSIIKELNSRIFKIEDIIQVLGQERNDDVVEELEFSDEFCHLSVKFCDELNHDFLELFESSIIDSVGTPLDADTHEEFDEIEDYLVKEKFMRWLEEEERLLLEEERLIKEEKRVRLEEQRRLMLEEERALEVKKRWDEDVSKGIRVYKFNLDYVANIKWVVELPFNARLLSNTSISFSRLVNLLEVKHFISTSIKEIDIVQLGIVSQAGLKLLLRSSSVSAPPHKLK
ncbi:hypothetical protein Tco_0180776 [Tanacetum coccineum]